MFSKILQIFPDAPGTLPHSPQCQDEFSSHLQDLELMFYKNATEVNFRLGIWVKTEVAVKQSSLKQAPLCEGSACRTRACRLAPSLAGKQKIEQFVVDHYFVDESYLPSGHITHPLLTDLEAAQLHVLWKVLHYHQCFILASLVFNMLTFCLHDTYTVSHLLNAGYLQTQYPTACYWELLTFDDLESITSVAAINFQANYAPDYGLDIFDNDSEMDDDELQYPMSNRGRSPGAYSYGTELSAIFTDSSSQ
ncbi:hypothetical protein B0H17DRAFT_1154000 [Mycena rosella]|uniref:Uncharacterized protein n=1 Tax=Mycena rosella TaxID=1033263 RepID=A0AAD7B1U7_MYCRO|nr:hypothetical protein B0H17DRAFT_1154000 [Mycena rosella]